MDRLRKMEPGRILRGLLCAYTFAFLLAALLAPDRGNMLTGLRRICTLPGQLTRDYFLSELGGVSASMLNAFLVGAVCCGLMFLPGAVVSGGTVLAYFLTVGFCTFGMSILSILPLMAGVAVYCGIRREPLGKNLNFFMFSTAVAPLITQLLFWYPQAGEGPRLTLPGAALALAAGIAFGCAMPALCAHSPAFHKGFDLYNAGPAAGFLCALFYALLYRAAGVEAPAASATLGAGEPVFAHAFCLTAFGATLLFGMALNGGLKGIGPLLMDRSVGADYARKYPAGLCLIHTGAYGLFILLWYDLTGATFTGPTLGAVFCMLACCLMGATARSVLPVMLGYFLASRLGAFPLNAQAIVVGLCFASGLAPVSNEYGWWAGAVAGALHYGLVTSVPLLHGGFCLYNGGFTAGIVCFVLIPLLERFGARPHSRSREPQGK